MRKDSPLIFIVALMLAAAPGFAELETSADHPIASHEPGAVEALDLPQADFLGLTLDIAQERFGTPKAVYSHRGGIPEYDDVVFVYENGFQVFWFYDRIWQVRYDRGAEGDILGVSMGAPVMEVVSILGNPATADPDRLTYHLRDRGFPARLALYFEDGFLSDAYVFRSDY